MTAKTETAPPEQPAPPTAASRFTTASQWQLVWWSFRKHKLAMLGAIVTLMIYVVAAVPVAGPVAGGLLAALVYSLVR